MRVVKQQPVQLAVSGSAGMGIAQECNFPFCSGVYATRTATKKLIPNADVIIELGGEDAKNSVCKRQHGSSHEWFLCRRYRRFIDQMSTLLHLSPEELNNIAKNTKKFIPSHLAAVCLPSLISSHC